MAEPIAEASEGRGGAEHQARLWRRAICRDDDEAIARFYKPELPGAATSVSALQRQRSELALRRVEALDRLRESLRMGQDQEVVDRYEAERELLENCRALRATERDQIAKARCSIIRRALLTAINNGNEAEIIAVGEAGLAAECPFERETYGRIALARRRLEAKARFDHALANGNAPALLLAAADPDLQASAEQQDHAGIILARFANLATLRAALGQGDDLKALRIVEQTVFPGSPPLAADELARLRRTAQRHDARRSLEQALAADTDDELSDRQITEAYQADADLLEPTLGPTERRRLALAQQRPTLLARLRAAVEQGDAEQIVAACNMAFSAGLRATDIPAALWPAILLARRFAEPARKFRRQLEAPQSELALATHWWQRLAVAAGLSTQENRRAQLARRRSGALLRLRDALRRQDKSAVAFAYQPVLLFQSADFDERDHAATALYIRDVRPGFLSDRSNEQE